MHTSRYNNGFNPVAGSIILIAVLLLLSQCNTAERVPANTQIKASQPWVFGPDFQKALYKTSMMVFGNEISGITIIKKTGRNYRVVMISEVGLKYFDMEFFGEDGSIKVHYVISLLDHKPVVEMLGNNYKLLFMIFPDKRKEKYYRDSMTKNMAKEIKYKGQKSRYNFNNNFGMVSTVYDKRRGNKLVIAVDIKDQPYPQTLNFNQRNLNLRLKILPTR